ncbi:hypothetical protein GCM10027347_43350 [Larkinella harenae]
MFTSIRSYIRLSKLAKALNEAHQNQFDDELKALSACTKKFRQTGKKHAVVKHEQHDFYYVVGSRSAQALTEEGYSILQPYKHSATI